MSTHVPDASAVTIGTGDMRYPALSRGFNQRWIAHPDYIKMVSSPAEAVAALQEAVNADAERGRVTVRSGGHCYEDFVCGDDVRVILDVSPMCDLYYDPRMGAWCLEAGASNWHGYSHLYPLSGRALPGGSCYSVGLGGHITGGGYGLLSRQAGLTVDYLYAVEVAVVTERRTVELVVATRDDEDYHLKNLWWAHTGGGGGNFGVVTRFWFRDLPTPPSRVLLTARSWQWEGFTKAHFSYLLDAYGEYFRVHQDPATPAGRLFALLALNHKCNGTISLVAQVDADSQDGIDAMDEFLLAVDSDAIPASGPMLYSAAEYDAIPNAWQPRLMPWLTATQALNSSGENRCGKYKSAYLRRPFTSGQIDAMWAYLGNEKYTTFDNKQALIQIDSYGSAINEHPWDETAVPQRDSILKMQYQVYWNRPSDSDPGEVARNLAWIRDTYRATFADTGGVPAIGDVTDGCYINYPDADLSDPEWNTSGDPWSRLYYKDSYPRLQDAKNHWDPLGFFRHQQSIQPLTG